MDDNGELKMVNWDDPTAGDDEDCGMLAAILAIILPILFIAACILITYFAMQ